MNNSDSSPHPGDEQAADPVSSTAKSADVTLNQDHLSHPTPVSTGGDATGRASLSGGTSGEARTVQDRVHDALLAGAPLIAADLLAGRPSHLGTVKLPTKRRPGRPRGRRFEEKVSVPLDKDLMDQIQAEAEIQHLPVSAVIRALCREALLRRREDVASGHSQSAIAHP
ncbi:hypothetical protein GCM10009795_026390 [Nocardioides hankookensis]|uniref:Ribbon-helix-helix protein, CopG family n=1 Tax=Nocardioides hankookensis TaxID=443157 RepID=A0ABW1LCG9_9ACTN